MKRFFLHLLLPLICFNLAGGYGIAASLTQDRAVAPVAAPTAYAHQSEVQKKESSVLANVAQLLKEAEEDTTHHFPICCDKALYRLPVLSFCQADESGYSIQHFLSLYDRTSKVRQPRVHLLDCVFII